jgi:hypothetical protein
LLNVKYIVFNHLYETYGLEALNFGSRTWEADVLPLNYSRYAADSKATRKARLTQYRKNAGRWQFHAVAGSVSV